jgi:ribosome-binding ATPase YchF (GTP1/OBG family)
MKIGLIGLSRSGKTSLFNLLTGQSAATSSFEGARAEMHAGLARVPDERVDRLSALFKPKKIPRPFGSSTSRGFSSATARPRRQEFRSADALLHVVRVSDAAGAARIPGDRRPETELILADLEVVERRLERLESQIKKKRTDADVKEQGVLLKVKPALEGETPIRAMDLPEDEARVLRGFTFLSQKPILHCLNLAEKDIDRASGLVDAFGLAEVANRPRTRLGWVSAVIEAEVAHAGPEQAVPRRPGPRWPAITRVLQDCYACSASSPSSVGGTSARLVIPRARARRTPPGRSTPTSRGGSSAPRSSAMTT